MPEAAFDGQVEFDPQKHRAAVVLCRTDHGNLHLGVLHRGPKPDYRALVLHLGWQDYMSRSWPWLRLWAVPEADSALLMSVAGHCRRAWVKYQEERVFPYALGDFRSTFDAEGRLELTDGSQGLTCATFVMALFRTAGIELVDEEGWPIRPEQDQAFLATIQRFAQPEHFQLLKSQVDEGVARVHPHEVLGAATLLDIPATFEQITGPAGDLLERLDDAIGR